MANPKKTEARLRQIRDRQWQDKWGKDYVPAIFATPKEAPSISECSILVPAKLGLRGVHTLSKSETWLAVFALFHPNVWDLHEGRILYPTPRVHFLHGHPRAKGQKFPPLRGTLDVMERMGILERHPVCKVRVGKETIRLIDAPFPYIGDLLLFLEDSRGPYPVNWNVKDSEAAFHTSRPRRGKPRVPNDPAAIDRNAMEVHYYADGEIPTRQLAGAMIDYELRCNLLELFKAHSHPINIPLELRPQIIEVFANAVGTRLPADKVCKELSAKHQLPLEDLVFLLKQSIWSRKIRIELFSRFLMNKPLKPQIRDPLEVYSDWFARA